MRVWCCFVLHYDVGELGWVLVACMCVCIWRGGRGSCSEETTSSKIYVNEGVWWIDASGEMRGEWESLRFVIHFLSFPANASVWCC